jgi:RNA polymerase sigma factor (sigma-70 family)
MLRPYPGRCIRNGQFGEWERPLEQYRIFRLAGGLVSIEANAYESVAMSAVAGRSACHLGGLSDDELVRLARSGDEQAFAAIVRRYRTPLVSYSRRWLDPHRAEEVVQHTFMKAYLCLRDDDRPLILRPWLYRVAHNAALNAVEKKGSDWEELDENYDGVPQPPHVAEQRARFLDVVEGIGALPDRQRDALLLNEFEGRCYADIAVRLGTSESGVRGLLRRARRQLRETAALFLPFPAFRELVRSDAGRLNVDRAGELIGSAGAVGGAGVAGGLTKVAAGMLAAGTIAGGGTAIEQQRDRANTAEAKAAEVRPAKQPGSVTAERTLSLVSEGGDEIGVAVPIISTYAGGGLVGGGTDYGPAAEGETLSGFHESPPSEQPAGYEEEPLVPGDPVLPISDKPEAESNEDAAEDETDGDADGEEQAEEPSESTSDAPASGDGDAEADEGTQADTQAGPRGPAALPAIQPGRG